MTSERVLSRDIMAELELELEMSSSASTYSAGDVERAIVDSAEMLKCCY